MDHQIKFFLFVLILICSTFQLKSQDNDGKEIVLRLTPSKENPRNSEGDFIKLNDGRILFIYTRFYGGSGDHSQASLAGRVSTDKGKTWSKDDRIVLSNEGNLNVMSVSLLRLSDGRIAMFYLRKNSETDCIPFMRISTDEAETWGEAIRCIQSEGYYVLNNSRVIQLKNGRLILPVALHGSTGNGIRAKATIMCYYSDDSGNSWQKSQQVSNPGNITLQEPGIIQLKNDNIMLYCRTDAGFQYFSFSNDSGESWSPIEAGNIKSPLSPATIKRIPAGGDLLLVWNNNFQEGRDGGKRTPLNLAISRNEGKSWGKIKTIESDPDGWYCYTAIDFVDNYALLAHCAGDRKMYNGLETTQITRLSLDWVYKDAVSEPYIKKDENGIIELACDEKDAQIRFTLDGSNPDSNSELFEKPISISKTTVLRMIAFKPGMPNSALVTKNIGSDIYQEAQMVQKKLLPGLAYNYFEGEISRTSELEKLQKIESGIVSQIGLEKARDNENFSLEFTGFINIQTKGKYKFYLDSNDGSTLFLNGNLFIDNDGLHGKYEVAAPVSLSEGYHSIRLKYFQNGGGKLLKLSWEGADFKKAEIPKSLFFYAE